MAEHPEGMPDLPADAEGTFDDEGRLKVDFGVAAGVPADAEAVHPVWGERFVPELEQPTAPDEPGGPSSPAEALRVAKEQRDTKIESGPAPTGEEPLPPLVLDLDMNKVKMRELRACERILLAVYGEPYPVMPSLDVMPADVTIALIAHKLLLHEGVDASRMTETKALEQADTIRAAFERAEEIDFATLGQKQPGEGEGQEPTDPTSAASGNGHEPSAKPDLTSKPPS